MHGEPIQTVQQGKTIVETANGEYLIMHPDGTITVVIDRTEAEKKAKAWYRRTLGGGFKIGVGQIEWRD
jgi:hypothetical protein